MNDRIAILRHAITAITQSLAGMDIRVTQAGVEAWVQADHTGKPIQVNLPHLPDNADETLINALQGFLDHEVAHILFTDFSVHGAIQDPHTHQIANILEDARIEKEMANKYRGCGLNLRNTSDFFLDNITQPELQKALKKGADEETLVGVLATPLLRSMSGQSQHQDYMKDKMHHVENFYAKIEDLAPQIENLKSTAEVVEMAKTIVKRIKDEEPPEPDNDDDDEDEEEENSSSPSASPMKIPGTSKGDDDEENDEDDSPNGSEDSDGDDESDKDGSEGKEEKKGKGDGKKSNEQPKGKVSNLDPQKIFGEIDKDSANDFDKAIAREMGEQAALAAKGSQYVVYTTDNDVIEPLRVGSGFKDAMLKELTDKVDEMIGPMSKELERAMRAKSLASWENGLKRGRINASALSRLKTGDDRVFRKKHQNITNDVAVSLVVDASGSMSGAKIHTAAYAAYGLASVLDRLGISNEVICFTTGNIVDQNKQMEQERKFKITYSRKETLYMPVIKSFNERIATETKKRFAWLPKSNFLRANIDGECVEIAYRRLAARKEKGKIMIVLSDGCPAGYGESSVLSRHLKDTVKSIEKSGTRVIGIGINSDEVKRFYSKNIIIKKIEELPSTVISELRVLLMSNN